MIRSLTLKFGRAPGMPPETVQLTPITVFVGPNNSGKSKVLQELHRFLTSGQRPTTDAILDRVEFEQIPQDRAEELIAKVTLSPYPNEAIQPGVILVGKKNQRLQVDAKSLRDVLMKCNQKQNQFCALHLSYNTLMLDGASRINLVGQVVAGDMQRPPQNSLQVLFQDDLRRAQLRRIIHDALGHYFTIDPTQLGHLRIRLSPRPPTSDLEERGIHDEAVRFHAQGVPMGLASDGIKAFTGMMMEIVAGDPNCLVN